MPISLSSHSVCCAARFNLDIEYLDALEQSGRDPTRIWIAVDHTTTSRVAMPLPTDPGTTTFQLIVSTTAPFVVN
jgi:hypothetical protein